MVASYSHTYWYIKICRSRKFAQKSYEQLKKHKIQKNKKKQPDVRLEPLKYGLRCRHSATRPTRHIIITLLVTCYKLQSKICLAYFLTRSYGKIPQCAMYIYLGRWVLYYLYSIHMLPLCHVWNTFYSFLNVIWSWAGNSNGPNVYVHTTYRSQFSAV